MSLDHEVQPEEPRSGKMSAVGDERGPEEAALTPWDETYARGGTVEEALRYAALIWPEFELTHDMVFLREELTAQPGLADLTATIARFDGDLAEIERRFNMVEVPELFVDPADDADVERLASLLAETWHAKLSRDYPDRPFVVEVLPVEEDGPWVRFYSPRPKTRVT